MKIGHHMCIAVDNAADDAQGRSTLRIRRITFDDYEVLYYPGTRIDAVEDAVNSGTAAALEQARLTFHGRHTAQAIADAMRSR